MLSVLWGGHQKLRSNVVAPSTEGSLGFITVALGASLEGPLAASVEGPVAGGNAEFSVFFGFRAFSRSRGAFIRSSLLWVH